jgi:hypothetical protein
MRMRMRMRVERWRNSHRRRRTRRTRAIAMPPMVSCVAASSHRDPCVSTDAGATTRPTPVAAGGFVDGRRMAACARDRSPSRGRSGRGGRQSRCAGRAVCAGRASSRISESSAAEPAIGMARTQRANLSGKPRMSDSRHRRITVCQRVQFKAKVNRIG